jgi:FixJ family two-component response regulator
MGTKANTSEAPLVFIVDDDVSVRRSTKRLLRSLGTRAESFASAQDLLNSGRGAEAACLILDVRMRNMDGLELQRRLSETKQRIPVIFFSARATKEEEDRALRSGAVAFLCKPVGQEVFLRVIRMALESAN